MKAYAKGLIAGTVCTLLLVVSIYLLNKNHFFDLKDLEVNFSSDSNLENSKIFEIYKQQSKLKMQSELGKSLFQLEMKAILARLQEQDWLEEVKIRRVFPSRLSVEIKTKSWMGLVLDQQRFYPMTVKGEILQPISLLQAPSLPVIKMSPQGLTEERRQLMAKTFATLPREGALTEENLVEMGWDGEGFFMVFGPDYYEVRLGEDDLELRIARVEKVLDYLQEHQMKWRIINAAFGQKVVVRLRKAR